MKQIRGATGLSYTFAAALALLATGFPMPASAQQTPPWEESNQARLSLSWSYNFDDGSIPPTLSAEGGYSTVPTDPVWSFTGTGDAPSIIDGRLGLHNVSQQSELTIRLDIPNGYDAKNIKYFWFGFDWFGSAPTLAFGTDDSRSIVLPDSLTFTDNSVGNHTEGYINFLPQPDSEWMTLSFSAGPGESAGIDNFQTGSICVPEPASFSLIALGGFSSFLARRKRLRRLHGKNGPKFEELAVSLSFLSEEKTSASLGGRREMLAYRIKKSTPRSPIKISSK